MKQRQSSARPKRKRSVEVLPTSIRLTDQLATAIRDETQRTGRPIAWIVREMLEESWKARRFPGIVFVEGHGGRRAHVAGAGFDVWRIVELVEEHGSAAAVGEHFPGLSSTDIDLAQAYARSFPKEIEFLRYVAGLGGTLR
jgi:uncharacterized protein (DUF433 family)